MIHAYKRGGWLVRNLGMTLFRVSSRDYHTYSNSVSVLCSLTHFYHVNCNSPVFIHPKAAEAQCNIIKCNRMNSKFTTGMYDKIP